MSTFVLTAAMYGVFSVNKWSFSIFLTLQGSIHFLPSSYTFSTNTTEELKAQECSLQMRL